MKKLILVITILGASAFAAEGASNAVEQRMDFMSAIGKANKSLSGIARGQADFKLETVQEAALSISQHSGQPLVDLFPEGSLDSESDAKPEIWQDWEKFSNLALALNSAAVSLGEIASEDEFSTAYKKVSDTCGGCHRSFRAKR